jgi:hypothetical protein
VLATLYTGSMMSLFAKNTRAYRLHPFATIGRLVVRWGSPANMPTIMD